MKLYLQVPHVRDVGDHRGGDELRDSPQHFPENPKHPQNDRQSPEGKCPTGPSFSERNNSEAAESTGLPFDLSDLPKHPASTAQDADATLDTEQRQHLICKRCREVPGSLPTPKLHEPHHHGRGTFSENSSVRTHVCQTQRKEWVDEINIREAE